MPVWGTLTNMLRICAREWRAALKFGAVPLAANVALVLFFTKVAPQNFVEHVQSWTVSLLSLLMYAPFCIAWYRTVLFGRDAVADRPFFTLTLTELRFFGGMLLVTVLAALLGAILAFVGAAIVILMGMVNPLAATIAGAILTIVGLAILLMALSRWSIGLAMIASGGKLDVQLAWLAAKPYGWPMAGVQIIIFTVIAVIAGILLSVTLPDFIEAVRTQTAASERSQIVVQLTGAIAGAIALWLSTTMYALVYRMAVPTAVRPAEPAAALVD